jgi:hypothetical protein
MMKLFTLVLSVFARRNGRRFIEAYHNVDTKPAAGPQ